MIRQTKLQNININIWNELTKKSKTASFFQTPQWLIRWSRHFSEKELVYEILIDNKLVGIAPFLIKDNKIELLGVSPVLGKELVTDFGDIIALPGYENPCWQEIIQELKTNFGGYKLSLNFLRENSSSLNILRHYKTQEFLADVSPYISLPFSWPEYLSSLSRKDRHELKRKINRLEKSGAKAVFVNKVTDTEIENIFSLISASSNDKSVFLSDKMKLFFKDILTTLPAENLQLGFMKLSGKNIAAVIAFQHNEEILLYNSGFDQNYLFLAPGLILKAYLIKEAINKKLKCYDFLRGNERYKFDLGAVERKLYNIDIDL